MAGPLDDLLPIRALMLDGAKVPFAPVLEFGTGFTTTFTESAEGPAQNKITVDTTAADDVTRTGTVTLSAAQAWADLGAVIAIDASTTTFYELSLQASWPDHTHSGEVADDADSVSAKVQVAITRDASTGITVEQRNGGSSWDLGRVLVRAVDGGSGSWKLQVERDALAADTATTATVTATVRVLSTQAWSGETTTSWVSLDGESGVTISSATPQAVGTAAAGSTGEVSDAGHIHAHGNQAGGSLHANADGSSAGFMTAAHYTLVNGAAVGPTVSTLMKRDTDGTCQAAGVTLVNASGNCTLKATTNGTVAQSLDVLADVVTATLGECNVTAPSGFSVAAGSHVETDASGNYSCTRTPAAAYVETYQNTITSHTSRLAQAASGAGKSRYILGGLGASGSANGVFVSGLENGNTVTGGAHWLAAGSLVSNVSDKIRFGTGTPGSMTSHFDVYQSSAGTTAAECANTLNISSTSGNLNLSCPSGNWGASSGGYVTLTPSAAAYVDVKSLGIDNAGPYSSPWNVVAYSASLTLNANLSDHHAVGAMTNNITSLTVSNVRPGSTFTVKLLQDGTGSWQPTWNASFKFGPAYANTAKTTANSVTMWMFEAEDATTWRCIGREEYTS